METDAVMNDRMCIVTRERLQSEGLVRFVAGPDGMVVPDLKRNLPGRGCWVKASRGVVDLAVKRKLFGKGLKQEVRAPDDLGALVDRLMAQSLLGSLGLGRKAGRVAMGAEKVEAAVRKGDAAFVLHALEAAADGVRKIGQARHAARLSRGAEVPAFTLFPEAEMSLALGATNVIHAAVLSGDGSQSSLKKAQALHGYRGLAAQETEAE